MIKLQKALSYIALQLLVFLLIFQPTLFRISISYLSIAIMLMYIIFKRRIPFSTKILKLFTGFFPFLVYLILSTCARLVNAESIHAVDAYIYNLKHVLMSSLFILVSAQFFVILSRHSKYLDLDRIEMAIIGAGLIQTMCCILAVAFPAVHMKFEMLVANNSRNEVISKSVAKYIYRSYCLSGYHYDILGYICSLVTTVCLVKGASEENRKYVVFSFLFLIISVFNARTGLVLSAIAMIIVYFHYAKKKSIDKIVQRLLVGLGLIIICSTILNFLPEYNRQWMNSIIEETKSLFSGGKKAGVYNQILNADIVFPKDLLFGIGAKPESLGFYAKDGSAIDSGYIQGIWRFGLIGLGLLIFGYLFWFYKICFNSDSTKLKCEGVAICLIVLLYYFKTYPITLHGANVIVFSYLGLCFENDSRRVRICK